VFKFARDANLVFFKEVDMPHIICEPCIGVKDRACVDVCPVEWIHPMQSEDRDGVQLFIHPEKCIDCGACVPVCPVSAIFSEDDIPNRWLGYTQKNKDYFTLNWKVFQEKWGLDDERRP
jgi:ferredoxin